MKILSSLAVMSFLLSGVSLAKEYILDKKNHILPDGYLMEEQMLMSMPEGKLSITANGNVVNGDINSMMSEVEERIVISPQKFRSLMKIHLKTGSMTLNGKEMPDKLEEEPLLNIPLIFEKKDGKWTARPEKGKLNAEQKKELEELIEDENKEASMYGYSARKVGDEWNVGSPALRILLGSEDLTKGKATVKFKGVTTFDRMECAELLVKFDVEGIEEGMDQRLKGVVNVKRSLEYLLDIKVTGEMEMEIKGEVDPGVTMKIEANSVIGADISVIAPAPAAK